MQTCDCAIGAIVAVPALRVRVRRPIAPLPRSHPIALLNLAI
ncbi:MULTISPECIES: hypothetical protein [unclassified Microcoleus]